LHFGARVLILDEPTSSLGVKEVGIVLRMVNQARDSGVAVIFITHNATHALSVGDRFTVLIQGKVAASFGRNEKTHEEVISLMAGGEELEALQADLERQSTDGDHPVSPGEIVEL
jgi:simple sugar transport system ATP-binding protein